jgi:adenine/guanine/hypoxanthine permease
MTAWLERVFDLKAKDTTPRREALAGVTTFMTMAYILFLNPSILGDLPDVTGLKLSRPAIMSSTALVAALMSVAMGAFGRVPLALAAGMGLNAVVTYQLVGGLKLTWPEAMGVIVTEGLVISALVVTGFREAVLRALPDALKRAVAIGIGLFLALIGFVDAGFVTRPGAGPVPVQLGAGGHLTGWPMLVFVLGFFLTATLLARRVRAAFLLGILGTTVLSIIVNAATDAWPAASGLARLPEAVVATPDLSRVGAFSFGFFAKLGAASAALVVLSVMLSDFFDTMGTVVAVGRQAGFLDAEGHVPRARAILLVDSLAAVAGGASGSSSATCYIESASGVAAGGRTGLTAIVCGLCFLATLAFSPLATIVPFEATAPTLILVGLLMMKDVGALPWDDPAEALPAFLTIVVMPFTFSITNGIGAGVLAHVVLSLVRGQASKLHPLLYVCAAAFLVYFTLGAG